ncbi:MAG: AbrB/MazE/SpoVT family DNA-binding domain-containing protein [Verrucomicrobiota bacterium]
MVAPIKIDTVNFDAKGQVVIPRRIRREFEVEEGTKAQVYEENGCIVLKPITAKFIKSLRGSLKGSGVMKAMMEDRKREREL